MPFQKWYENNFRRNLVDMHIDAWNDEFLSKFDPDAYFNCLKKAQIKGPMIYTHSHVGYTNWPSKSGQMHPCFVGDQKIEKLFELCNAAGMDVIAYYSLIYNNWAYDRYPEWRMLDVDRKPSREIAHLDLNNKDLMMEGRGRYGLVCPNNSEYRDFLKLQFAELCEHFTFKAIFLDMTFWPIVCYCDSCKARFRDETGNKLPENIDWTDPAWLLFQQKREEWMTEFAFFATDELKKINPEVDVEHQYSTATHAWSFGVGSKQADASDYIGGDLYGGFEQQSLICKLYYGITKNQPFEYMTSRCDPNLNDHTTTKSLEALKLHAYLTYAHHGAFLAIDAIDPRGTLNEKFYDTLGQLFGETKAYENHFKGKLYADVALYFSFRSKLDYCSNKVKRAYATGGHDSPHLDCVIGAAKALRRSHTPYRVISDHDLDCLSYSKTVVLSDIAFMTGNEEEALYNYVSNGGSLYISGITSKNLVKRLLDIDVTGMTRENITYMRPTADGLRCFEGMYDQDYPLTVFGTQMLAKDNGENNVLATITLPYTDPQDLSTLASIHSNPPGINTESPAIVYGQCGKGHVIWSAAPIENSEQPVHKRVFVNLINLLTDDYLVRSNAPPQIEFTIFVDEAADVIQIHCVNIQEQFPMIPMPGFEVSVRTAHPAKSFRNLPDGKDIAFEMEGSYLNFRVDAINIFAMFEIGF